MSFTRVLRKHMNKMLIILAVIIAVTFTLTGTIADVLSRLWQPRWGEIFGEPVSQDQFQNLRSRILQSREMMGADTERALKEEEVWEYMALIREAERLGVKVPPEELRGQIMQIYRRYMLLKSDTKEEYRQKLNRLSQLTQAQLKAMLDSIQLDVYQYKNMVNERYGMEVREFERMLHEIMLINNLLTYVQNGAIATSKEIYEDFIEENHRRKIDFLHLDSENYEDEVAVDEEAVAELYKERESYYRENEKIAFEYIFARTGNVRETLPEPSEEKLKKYYNRKRSLYFRKPESEEETVEEPEDIYKPFSEVRDEVEYFYKNDEAKEKSKELVRELARRVNELENPTLFEVAEMAAQAGLEAGETPLFHQANTSKLNRIFGYCPQAARMFDPVAEVGGRFEAPYSCNEGELAYRISRHVPERTKPLEEVREELERVYRIKKASELAGDKAEKILEEAKVAGGFTDDIILGEKLPRVTTDYFYNSEQQEELKTVEVGDRDIIDAAFAIEEVKDFAEPVKLSVAGKDQYYLVQLRAKLDPNPYEFLNKHTDLLKETEQLMSDELIEAWKKDLLERANGRILAKAARESEEPGEDETTPIEEPPLEVIPGQ